MILFMFLLFPMILIYSLAIKDFLPTVKQRYVPVLIGFLFATLYSFIELFFIPAYHLVPYAFSLNYAYFLTFEILIPCLLCFLILFLFIKKQETKFLLLYFIFLGFYTVYFPARVINRNSVFDWYLLFAKPIIYACMLLGIKTVITHLYHYINGIKTPENTTRMNKLTIPKFSLLLGACFLIPPAIDVMHLLGLPMWTISAASILYSTAFGYGISLMDKECFEKTVLKVKKIATKIKTAKQKKTSDDI